MHGAYSNVTMNVSIHSQNEKSGSIQVDAKTTEAEKPPKQLTSICNRWRLAKTECVLQSPLLEMNS